MPVPNVVRVRLRHTLGDDFDVLSRFFIQYAGTAPSDTDLDTFAGAVGASWVTEFLAYSNTDTVLTEVICTDLSSSMANEGSATEDETGTRTGGSLPASTCLLINFQISRRYRGGKPRIYLPLGSDSDLLTAQTWNPTFVSEVGIAWAAFIAAVIAEPWSGGGLLSQVVPSFFEGTSGELVGSGDYVRGKTLPIPRAVPLVEPITGFSVNPIFGSQRRRNRPK
jgi:hypothetical protein